MNSISTVPQHTRDSIRGQLSRHQLRLMLITVSSVALLIRLGPTLWFSALRGNLHTDDGVYFAAAQHLVVSELPYRDFVFVHPPGIAVALAPLAALGHLVGDANAFAGARLLVIAIGAANAALVAWIAGRQGIVAGIVGGLFYAVWRGAVTAEVTVFLEPFQTLGLLLAVALLTSQTHSPRRAVIAGMLAGATLGFKLWTAPVLVVLAVWLFCTSRVRETCWFVVGCALSLAAIVGPFLALAPRQMWHQVVLDQASRARSGAGIADRLRLFAGAGHQLDALLPGALVVLVAIVTLVGIVVLVRGIPNSWLWCSILGVQLAELLLSPSYYDHYPALVAGSLAVLIGFAVGRGVDLLDQGRGQRFVIMVSAAALLAFSGSSVAFAIKRAHAVDNSSLRAFALRHQCVWASSPVAIIADQSNRNVEHGCDYEIDSFGVLLDDKRAEGIAGDEYAVGPTISVWQRRTQAELARSDAVILDPYNWGFDHAWSAETREAFLNRFKRVGDVGEMQLWSISGQ